MGDVIPLHKPRHFEEFVVYLPDVIVYLKNNVCKSPHLESLTESDKLGISELYWFNESQQYESIYLDVSREDIKMVPIIVVWQHIEGKSSHHPVPEDLILSVEKYIEKHDSVSYTTAKEYILAYIKTLLSYPDIRFVSSCMSEHDTLLILLSRYNSECDVTTTYSVVVDMRER